MRVIDRKLCRVNKFATGPHRRSYECRVWRRMWIPKFLMPGLHRPTGCAYWHARMEVATRPSGWAGERP